MFSVSASHWGLSVAFTIIASQCQAQLLLSPGVHYPSVMLRIVAVQAHLSIINYMLNDVVVIWRAWLLCGPKARRWIWAISVLTLVAESVLAVYKPAVDPHYWTQFFAGITIEGATQANSFTDGTYLRPLYAAYCLTLLTNVWPTMIIGYKAWTHQKLIAGTSVEHGSRALRILVLLVESGAIYCVIWAIHLCFFFLNAFGSSAVHDRASWIAVTYSAIYVSANDLAVIYPTVIIVLVCLQKTLHEARTLSPSEMLTTLPLRAPAFDVATHTISQSVCPPNLHCPRLPICQRTIALTS
ncbi:uncharacterized protein STEHIDRAFT_160376 [Stereum hirsutum FP-91666 SS1]|uniref:uncharacterized protein n=1 Tax=Stereum hirsutum (strain FP-91666) TaxID=721885 RepID=UPI000444A45F|nr:uncharacterized protein STEHIDRAFT_160376 [Stereum hirsutum FP-91666 SS1]EIM82748.1 hypothetical protein STEHIDRAFT_160376 [Stereum hirsutum FP-91666 SS1]